MPFKILAIITLLLLPGCAYFEAAKAFKAGVIDPARFKVAMEAEELRCKRSPNIVLAMAAEKGDVWLRSYVQSCPNWQSFVGRILGLTIAPPPSPIDLVPRK